MTAFAASCIQQGQKTQVPVTSAETPDPIPARVSTKTFQAFSHQIPEHKQFDCNSCHQREGRSLKIELAGHESCVGCHLNQFTNRDDQVMCGICHENLKLDQPTTKTFPAKFIEGFNMKFDHAAHTQGKGRPAEGCASCHEIRRPRKDDPGRFPGTHDMLWLPYGREQDRLMHRLPRTRPLQPDAAITICFQSRVSPWRPLRRKLRRLSFGAARRSAIPADKQYSRVGT